MSIKELIILIDLSSQIKLNFYVSSKRIKLRNKISGEAVPQ